MILSIYSFVTWQRDAIRGNHLGLLFKKLKKQSTLQPVLRMIQGYSISQCFGTGKRTNGTGDEKNFQIPDHLRKRLYLPTK